MNRLPRKKRVQILNLLMEGNSIRGTARLTNTSTHTVERLIVNASDACREFHNQHIRGLNPRRIEMDEMWHFVYAKEKNVPYAINPPDFVGDCWTHIALDPETKLLISCHVGTRKLKDTRSLIRDVQRRLTKGAKVHFYSDGYSAYKKLLPKMFGLGVSHTVVIGTEKNLISGKSDQVDGNTTFVERHNLTIRMSVRRQSRKTNAFSKRVERHCALMNIYTVWYNWCRIHQTLEISPAMEAGLSTVLYDMEFIVDLVEDRTPPPTPRGPDRKPRRRRVS